MAAVDFLFRSLNGHLSHVQCHKMCVSYEITEISVPVSGSLNIRTTETHKMNKCNYFITLGGNMYSRVRNRKLKKVSLEHGFHQIVTSARRLCTALLVSCYCCLFYVFCFMFLFLFFVGRGLCLLFFVVFLFVWVFFLEGVLSCFVVGFFGGFFCGEWVGIVVVLFGVGFFWFFGFCLAFFWGGEGLLGVWGKGFFSPNTQYLFLRQSMLHYQTWQRSTSNLLRQIK